jgi:hypothetical protein
MSLSKGYPSYEERWELRSDCAVYIKNSLYRYRFTKAELKEKPLSYWTGFLDKKPWHIDRSIPDFKNLYWKITNEI